ncbi:hypothetical protein BDZ94DRAFT_1268778 [Collybia nuda]|uniref:Uncharacterized protein n=1 Tax=Collybia nuda TaxID=64659 RepID=A0A9P5XWZ3_9AGAR|nr:hypothetical protein BDZ94DRAFT_1268778 [Collybia nuda]
MSEETAPLLGDYANERVKEAPKGRRGCRRRSRSDPEKSPSSPSSSKTHKPFVQRQMEDGTLVSAEVAYHKESGTQLLCAKVAREEIPGYFKVYDLVAQAALYKTSTDTQDVNYSFVEARADGFTGSYIGCDASFCLISGSASIFDFKLGVGAATGLGIKDDSLEAKLIGCGFSLGKRIEASVFGTSFGVNLERLGWW